jgi:uncharacterized protein YndB with AHSA1/START domain
MATPLSQPQNWLELRRTFAAPRERVFRAWTDAIISQLDLKVGGKYSLEMHHKGGDVHKLSGTYQQVKPPEKLVFTWRWATDPPGQESVVSLEFHDLGNTTEILLTHGQFPSAESREKHNHGWKGCFEQFQQYLAQA